MKIKLREETDKKMKAIIAFLIEQYGEVKPEWEITLSLLEDNLELLKQCQDSVEANGIYDIKTHKKNPLLSTIKDINAIILKISQKLGISPWDASKIKTTEEDDTSDFIDGLVS